MGKRFAYTVALISTAVVLIKTVTLSFEEVLKNPILTTLLVCAILSYIDNIRMLKSDKKFTTYTIVDSDPVLESQNAVSR